MNQLNQKIEEPYNSLGYYELSEHSWNKKKTKSRSKLSKDLFRVGHFSKTTIKYYSSS